MTEEAQNTGSRTIAREYTMVVALLLIGMVVLGRYVYKQSGRAEMLEYHMHVTQSAMKLEIEQLRMQLGAEKSPEALDFVEPTPLDTELKTLQSELSALTLTLRSIQQQQSQLSTKLLQTGEDFSEPGNQQNAANTHNEVAVGQESITTLGSDEHAFDAAAIASTNVKGTTTVLSHGISNPTNAQNSQRAAFETTRSTIYSSTTNGAYTSQGPQKDTGFPFPYGTTTNTNTAFQNTLTTQGGSTARLPYQVNANGNYGSRSSNGAYVIQQITTTNQNLHQNSSSIPATISSNSY